MSRYESSPANLRALRDRLTQAAKREGVVFGRLQQHVAVLVVTQFMAAVADERDGPLLLVKGGASLELRCGIPASRTSKDLDAVTRADIEIVHDRLADAGETGWEDFTAVFTPPVPFEVVVRVTELPRSSVPVSVTVTAAMPVSPAPATTPSLFRSR